MLSGLFFYSFMQRNEVVNIFKIVESFSLTLLRESDKNIYKHLTYCPSVTYDPRVFVRCFETIGY